MRASGGCGILPAFCASLLILWILVIAPAHGQAVGDRRRIQRRGGSVIRTRVASQGLPIRSLRPVLYDPIFAASDAVTGYTYSRPAVGETTTETAETEVQESPSPSSPVKDFMDILKVMPIAGESDQQIDSESVTPQVTMPVMRLSAKIPSSSGSPSHHSNQHGGDDFWPEGYKGVIPGEAGVDYPTLSSIPDTSFSCGAQQYSGYYADEEARCQVFHVCLRRPTRRSIEKWSFLCPNGTVFSQEEFVCVWWNQAPNCDSATLGNLYLLNAKLGWDSHDETATKSIKTIMESMVQGQRTTVPMFMTTTPIAAPVPRPTQRPVTPTSPVRGNGNRIPVSLTATLGKNTKPVTITTSVPITTITKNMIINSDGQPITYSTQDEYDSQQEIDSQVVTGVRSQSEARKQTKTGSSKTQSESEAYELFGRPNAIPGPNPLIVNRRPGSSPDEDRTTPLPDVDVDGVSFSDYEIEENSNTARPVPTVVMMPVEQTYVDGSKAVVDMPVLMMVTPTTTSRPTTAYAPVGVANPNGVTIPNLPSTPPRSYLPPRYETSTTPIPVVPTTMVPATYLPPRVEEEPMIDYEYEKDKSPTGSRPIIDYEMINSVPAIPETTTTTTRPVGSYLPPRTEAPEQSTAPPQTTFAQPEPPTTQREYVTEATTSAPVTENDSVAQNPSGGYLPPPVSGGYSSGPATATLRRPRPTGGSSTFVAMDGALINQILDNAGVRDNVEDGQNIVGFSSQGPRSEDQTMAKSPISVKIESGDSFEAPRTNNLADKLEKITPGYIDLPLGPGPTQLSPELPGTEGVQAFLTSQKNVDSKQTLEIFNFGKYALFMPKGNSGAGETTPAPTGLIKGSADLPKPSAGGYSSSASVSSTSGPATSTLFGPLARDVMPAIMEKIRQQIAASGGYSSSNSQQSSSGGQAPVLQKPSGLYGVPNREFQSSSSSQSSGGYKGSMAEVTVQTTVERRPIQSQAQSSSQGGYSQQQSSGSSQGGYSSRPTQQSSSSSGQGGYSSGTQQQSSSSSGQGGYSSGNQQQSSSSPGQGGYSSGTQQQSSSSSGQGGYSSGTQQQSSSGPSQSTGSAQQSSSGSSQGGQGGYSSGTSQQSSSSSGSGQGGYSSGQAQQASSSSGQGGYSSGSAQQGWSRPSQGSGGYGSSGSSSSGSGTGGYSSSSGTTAAAQIPPPPGRYIPPRDEEQRAFRPSEPDPGLFRPVPTGPAQPLGTPLAFSPQIQLPVLVETHSSQDIPVNPSQQTQQGNNNSPPAQSGGYQQQAQNSPPPPPPPPRPSGLYGLPNFDQFAQQQRIVSPQPSILPNPGQLQSHMAQLRMPSTQLPELIQAIPVHASTYVETRPVNPNFQGPYMNNGAPMIPPQAFQPVNNYLPPPQSPVAPVRFTSPQPSPFTNVNPNVAQYHHQIQYQQAIQSQYPRFVFQTQSPAVHFNSISDPQRGSTKPSQVQPGGYGSAAPFSSSNDISQHNHQNFHQHSHQQHIQQFIQQQQQRIRSVNHQLQHSAPSQRQPFASQPSQSYGPVEFGGQGAYSSNSYAVYYPGKDKSRGVKLTY